MYVQLLYGLIVIGFFNTGTPMFYAGGPKHQINAATAIEIYEATAERAAGAGLGGWPFTYTTTNRIAYQIEAYGYSPWTNVVYGGTGTGWRAWSFAPLKMATDLWGNPNRRIDPFQGSSISSHLLQRSAFAIDWIAPYYVRSYTATSITMWTAADLWTAAGSPAGNPYAGTYADMLDLWQPVTTSTVWILHRALTNLNMTVGTTPTRAVIGQWEVWETNATPLHLEETALAPPPWWADYAYVDDPLNLAAYPGGWNPTNYITGWAPTYPGPTNATFSGSETNYEEVLSFDGPGNWSKSADDPSPPDTIFSADNDGRNSLDAKRTRRTFNMPIADLATNVVATVHYSFKLVAWLPGASTSITFYNATTTAVVTCHGPSTNWAGTATAKGDFPNVSTFIDLTQIRKTNTWHTQGFQLPDGTRPTMGVSVQALNGRLPVVAWTFSRCHP